MIFFKQTTNDSLSLIAAQMTCNCDHHRLRFLFWLNFFPFIISQMVCVWCGSVIQCSTWYIFVFCVDTIVIIIFKFHMLHHLLNFCKLAVLRLRSICKSGFMLVSLFIIIFLWEQDYLQKIALFEFGYNFWILQLVFSNHRLWIHFRNPMDFS